VFAVKIIILASLFPPYVGGVSVRAYRIARGLTKRGHEVNVHTLFHPKVPLIERIDGIKVERHHRLNPFFSGFVKLPAVIMPSLLKVFGEEEIREADVVQSLGWLSFSSLAAASLKLLRRKVFVLLPIFSPYYRWHVWSVKLYRWTVGVAIIKYADFVVPETSLERDKLMQLGVHSDKIQVIPNAIDSESYEQMPDPTIFRNKYGIDAGEKIILFVGAPLKSKGVDNIILAMEGVLKKIKEARLVLIGPNARKALASLRRLGSSNVRDHTVITGSLTGKNLVSAYSAADLFVLPSQRETFGMVIVEAAAAGLPIVCTRTGVAPDIVVNGKNGLFVGWGKVKQLSNAITRVLMDSNFKSEAERRRDLILKNYDVKTEIDQYEKIYRQLHADLALSR